MRYRLTIMVFVLSFCFGFSQNLVSNSSFESNGHLNCATWYDGCHQELIYLCDTLQPGNPCDIAFYKDTPPQGGNWSLGATGIGNSFPATASTFITGQNGTHQYLLNVWMKDDGLAFGGATIWIRSKGSNILGKTIQAESPDWTFYSIKDTLTLQPADSIQITLSAFAAGPAFGYIYFDNIEFILLDSLTSVPSIDQDESNLVSLFPNPAKENLILNIPDSNNEHFITFYTSTGQLMLTLRTSEQRVMIDMKGWTDGLYFYTVERSQERQVIAAGNFVVE